MSPQVAADNVVRVKVVQKRKGGEERPVFVMIPIEAGLRISRTKPW